ncbi:calcium-binding protein [Bradyrhizobium sp. STM 3557]|uniref:calcium-binding protein n=1 Tax=Bradyrhizobium sp. STM 3557 TaxID=578920 RepID=UPI00388F04E1
MSTLPIDIENAIFSALDNLKTAAESRDKHLAIATIQAMAGVFDTGISVTGLVAQLGGYVAGGGTVAALTPHLERLNGIGLAADFGVSLIGIGVAYVQWSANPTFENQHSLQKAIGKLIFQTLVAGLFLALGGIGPAALAFGIVGQLADPESLQNFLDVLSQVFDRAVKNPLLKLFHDPIVFDLNGDGVQLSSLAASGVHFDYAGDGFAERTGWVAGDDGMLAIDANGNGKIDNGLELFGSSSEDGFAVLETFDSNGDGKIDAQDAGFNKLLIWRDLNQNGISDPGELQTLASTGITSISLDRRKLSGTNADNGLGYQASFVRADGTTGVAQTIYFQADPEHSISDNTPNFTASDDVLALPQLPGSGLIYSIAYKAQNDGQFAADWAALADSAPSESPAALREAFEAMLFRWAGVDGVDPGSRGAYVDARHLAFVEKFFGDTYREVQFGQEIRTFPSNQDFGNTVESTFEQIVSIYETYFLSQVSFSSVLRGVSDSEAALNNPYFFYSLLDFGKHSPGDQLPATPGNIGMVVDLMTDLGPSSPGDETSYLIKSLSGLNGIIDISFAGDRASYVTVVEPHLASIVDEVTRVIATDIVQGAAFFGSTRAEGINGTAAQDVFIGGGGGDVLSGGGGSDIYVYNKQDGDLWIKDDGAASDTDRLVLTDVNALDVTFDRIGDDLLMRIASTGKTIAVERFFTDQGVDVIRFADGAEWDRARIKSASVYRGDGHNNAIYDSNSDDVIHGGTGDDYIHIGGGNDTILYGKGDGYDVVDDGSGARAEKDKLVLTDLNPADVVVSRVGAHLVVTVKSTGEYIDFDNFFPDRTGDWATSGRSIDTIQFADGTTWNRDQIQQNAWVRGTDRADGLGGSELNDTIEGGKGDDVLQGYGGSDTYVWRKGDGNDEISDTSSTLDHLAVPDVDTLWLKDVSANEVSYSYQGTTLLITIKSTGEIIRVDDFFKGVSSLLTGEGAYGFGIDQIKFQDGSIINRQQITYNAGVDYLGWVPTVSAYVVQGLIQWEVFVDEFGHSGNIVGHFVDGIDDIWNASSFGGYGGILGTPDALQPNPFHGGGNNILNGNIGNDILAGGDGGDIIGGGNGDDILYGDYVDPNAPGGNDVIDGGAGDDVIYGGAGMDLISGGEGNDYLAGGDGKDYIDGYTGDDTFVGGRGDDILISNDVFTSGNDTYIYSRGDGNDTIYESATSDAAHETDILVLTDLSSSDVELSRSGDDLLVRIKSTDEIITIVGQFTYPFGSSFDVAGAGIESIRFTDAQWDRVQIQQAAWYRGTDGRDIISGAGTAAQLDSTFDGGKGNDIIYGGRGSDTFVYARGDGNDTITDGTGNGTSATAVDTLKFTDLNAADVELGRSGNDLLVKVRATGEIVTVASQFAGSLTGSDVGLERILFADGTELNRLQIQQQAWFRGTDGNDIISLSGMDDTVEGGKGNDVIYSGYQGGSGNDTFIYAKGDGNDVIQEESWASRAPTEIDTLKFKDIDSSDIALRRSGNDLLVTILSTNETITVLAQFNDSASAPGNGLEYIEFANGDQWGRETIRSIVDSNSPFIVGGNGNDHLVGSAVNQNIYGEAGDDTIDGQGGSDLLYGGLGNDTLVLSVSNAGDLVTIDGGVGVDTLDLSDFGAAAWVDLVTNGAEVRTTDQSSLATGTLRDMANVANVENITGTAFSDQLAGDAGNNVIIGGAGDDVLDGRSGDDQLLGGAGNDVITGSMGADVLDGGDGADTLNGGLGSDILIGGAGDDVLTGGTEGDVFVVGLGSGADTITDFTAGSSADHDVVRFDRALFPGYAAVLASSQQVGSDFVIPLGDGNSVTLKNVNLADLTAADFEFRRLDNKAPTAISVSGGTVTENAAAGTVVATLAAIDAGDTGVHTFTLANDSLFELVGNEIRVKDGAVIDFEQAAQHQLTVTATDDDGLSVTSVITIAVADQVELMAGTAGADVLNGGAGADILVGGAGDDRLVGGGGSDEYRYQLGDGSDRIVEIGGAADTDKLVFGAGIDPASIAVGRSSLTTDDMVLLLSNGNTIALQGQLSPTAGSGVEQVVFADGTVWSRADVLARLSPGLIIGSPGVATLAGGGGNDVLVAGAGDTALSGYGGSDVYRVGADFGNDVITEGSEDGTDRIEFVGMTRNDVLFSREGQDLVIRNRATGNTIKVMNQFGATSAGIEEIAFADGQIWNRNQITANAPVRSTSADGTVTGTPGDDVLEPGPGNQLIQGGGGSDTIVYALGDGSDTINDGANSPSQIDVLKFVDLNASDFTFARQGNDLTIKVLRSGDIITVKQQFGAATDYWGLEQIQFADGTLWDIEAIAESTWTKGTSGDDTINGTSGNDVIAGMGGNDTLNGGPGDDTYVYRRGDGNDTIIEGTAGNFSTFDTLRLKGIAPSAISFVRNGNDVTLVIAESAPGAGDGGSILIKATLDNFFSSGVEQFVLDDGTLWTQDDLRVKVLAQYSTPGNDIINGYNTNDVITGGRGDDVMSGGVGDDTYIYNRGDGNDTIIEGTSGNNTTFDTLRLHGIDPRDISFLRNGNDMTLVIAESAPGAGDGGSILIKQTLEDFFSQGVEQIVFDNGTVWTQADLRAFTLQQATASGASSIYGFNGADTIAAGTGNRYLNGGGSSDTYIYTSAGGNDVIEDPTSGNVLLMQDIASTAVSLSRPGSGADLIIQNSLTGKTVTVKGQFSSGTLSTITFGDGVSWSQAQILDVLAGSDDSSAYLFNAGTGQVTVTNTVTTIKMGAGIASSDLYFQANGNGDLVIKFKSGNDVITVPGDLVKQAWGVSSSVIRIKFSDGTVLALGQPAAGQGTPLTFTWLGNTTNYTITGTTFGNNVYEVTTGGKVNFADASGAGGINIVKFDKGAQLVNVQANNYAGRLDLGPQISAKDVYWQTNQYGDLILKIRGDDADSINVWGDMQLANGVVTSAIKTVNFSDGTVLDMSHGPQTFTWLGNTANYTITGTNLGTNVYEATIGGKVNFADSAAAGGINIVKFDKGAQLVNVQANNYAGRLDLGPQISAKDVYWQTNQYGDLILKIRSDDADSINVWGDMQLANGVVTSAIKTVNFSDGTVLDMSHGPQTFTWLGNTANYTITGTNLGTNVYEATIGGKINFANSAAAGGINIVKFDKGAQLVNVQANNYAGRLDLGPQISAKDVYWQTNQYGDLILKIRSDDADSINVWGDMQLANGVVTSAIKTVNFSDGTVLDMSHGPANFTWIGSTPNFNLTGTTLGTNVYEVSTSGTLNFANASAAGGTNIVKYDRGDQNLVIWTNKNSGTIELGAGITEADVYWQEYQDRDLILKIRGDDVDSIAAYQNWQVINGNIVSNIGAVKFSDGTVLDLSHGPSNFTWFGNAVNFNITGSTLGTNVYDISTSGTITFGKNAATGGTNIVKYDRGDQNLVIWTNNSNGIIDLGPQVSASDIYWQEFQDRDLILKVRNDANDSISAYQNWTVVNGSTVSLITAVRFADGTVLDLSQGQLAFTWMGAAANYNLVGSNRAANVFEVTQGNGSITFGNASGGGSGKNTIKFAKGAGIADVYLNGGTGTIAFGAGITADDIYLQSNDSNGDLIIKLRDDAADAITVHSDLVNNSWGVSSGVTQLQFANGSSVDLGQPAVGQGSPLTFTWTGTSGATITGSAYGANVFEMGPGTESFTGGNTSKGGNGYNTYVASVSTGHAIINPNEAAGSSNELDFIGDITDQNLWFVQSGNNLQVDLLGTNTSVTVNGWFSSSANQLQEITAGDLKIDSQISQLVQAMATYSANHAGFDPTNSSVQVAPNDPALQNAIATAWHA